MNQLNPTSYFRLCRAILSGTWYMDMQHAQSYLPIAYDLISGNSQLVTAFMAQEQQKHIPFSISLATGKSGTLAKPKGESIAVIPVRGALEKEDYCGVPGTSTLGDWVEAADQNPEFIGSILLMDSPGGNVDGTEEFAAKVAATSKPVIAFVDTMMASAAEWVGSGANETWLIGETAMVGSIGTMISLADFKGYYEEKGVKIHNIFADKSKDKNQTFLKAMEGDYKPMQKELLNPLNEVFLNAIKTNRAGKIDLEKENVLTGKVYLGSNAIKVGLADRIGTFKQATERIKELSENTKSDSTMKLFTSIFQKIKQENGTEPTETELSEAVDNHTAQLQAQIAALSESETALKAERDQLAATIQTMQQTIDTQAEEITALGGTTAEDTATVDTDTERSTGEVADDDVPLTDHEKKLVAMGYTIE